MGHNCGPVTPVGGGRVTWRQANRAFIEHARTYVLVNAFLVAIWTVTMFGGYFWPIWPMLGWGIGLVAHAMATFNTRWVADDVD